MFKKQCKKRWCKFSWNMMLRDTETCWQYPVGSSRIRLGRRLMHLSSPYKTITFQLWSLTSSSILPSIPSWHWSKCYSLLLTKLPFTMGLLPALLLNWSKSCKFQKLPCKICVLKLEIRWIFLFCPLIKMQFAAMLTDLPQSLIDSTFWFLLVSLFSCHHVFLTCRIHINVFRMIHLLLKCFSFLWPP